MSPWLHACVQCQAVLGGTPTQCARYLSQSGTTCMPPGELWAAAQHPQSRAPAVHAGSERADLPMLQTRRPST